jgi:hypothetical protein
MGLLVHLHSPVPYRYGVTRAPVDGYNGRFVYDNLPIRHDEGICGSQIYRKFLLKKFKEAQCINICKRLGNQFSGKNAQNYSFFGKYF